MPFILILVAAIIAIAAFNNAQGTLAVQLEQDVPAFLKWALALVGVGALGWIPGMEKISRYLLALVMVVLVVKNYSAILSSFQNFGQCSSGANANAQGTASTPAQAYVANPNAPAITQAQISGQGTVTGSGASSAQAANINANAQAPTVTSPYGAFDPGLFVAAFEAGFGGFGGII